MWLRLLCALLLVCTVRSQTDSLNQYEELTGSDGESIWRSTSPFVPVQSAAFGSVLIGRSMSMSFSFVWHGRVADAKYEQFFRISFDSAFGNGCDGQGSRYPSLWLLPDEDALYISAASGELC